ncbi:PVC-type heme-binding CxxCH protein [Neorhodopirellula pilleata]|nr:PVC-type heme-binding CxxCH protein [Neorhodopirellula pilleata]
MLHRILAGATAVLLIVMPIGKVPCACSDDFVPVNTQPHDESPLSPNEAIQQLTVPPGFEITLAAAEPEVQQPIAITYDDRGRLWVAESYSYNGSKFTDEPHDRILIFEDTTGNGVLDRRTVFCDGLTHLTGLEIGFGGVWITAPPHLSFIPDKNLDDVPDGDPIVHLDGWSLKAEHNSVNGLDWGPDGWLYGRHGIKQPSRVGRPGTPAEQRVELSCCIWRYHPIEHQFEVVADGTINPWGLDFDEHGEGFLTTSVVDHLWHLIPGAHYERWKDRGTHPDPYAYELMSATCDHLHWASGQFDKQSRVAAGNLDHGGGHSHCDAMIYLGGRWPSQYHGALMMSNIHGRRINCDRLLLDEIGYRGIHEKDFLVANDPWFRAVSMEYGPDGDVHLTDWSDNGECHDRDGVHRTSGRIYKISWGSPRRVSVDLQNASDERLVEYQTHHNEWFVRHARRILQERAAAGNDMSHADEMLRQMFQESDHSVVQLRAIWALHAINRFDESWLNELLINPNEHVRCWALRLILEKDTVSQSTLHEIESLAKRDRSGLVQLTLASSMQRIPVGKRWPTLLPVAERSDRWQSDNLQRMIWYALEPEVASDPAAALNRLDHVSSVIRRWIARRITEMPGDEFELIFDKLDRTHRSEIMADLLEGFNQSSAELKTLSSESIATIERLIRHPNADVRLVAVTTGASVGGERTIQEFRTLLHDSATGLETAQGILSGMVRRDVNGLQDDLKRLFTSGRLVVPALQAAATLKASSLVQSVLDRYPHFDDAEKSAAIDFLTSRKPNAKRLLDAIEQKTIPPSALSAEQARQVRAFNDVDLTKRLEKLWGSIRPSPEDRLTQIHQWEQKLTTVALEQTDLTRGRYLFKQHCGNCHRLFGEGETIGPDLTGSNRGSLHYLLSNVIDPSASVPIDFRLAVVLTLDGRVVTGILAGRSASGLTIKTARETVNLPDDEIESFDLLPQSMMPDGLLDPLSDREVRDLFAWLMQDAKIEKPSSK